MATKNLRKILGLIISVVIYYVIHEGAHLIVALALGTFERIRFAYWGLGVQIVADVDQMTEVQLFIFGTAGAVATFIIGYILVWQKKRILKASSSVVRAVAYYATIILLFLDPFYLSVICRFIGGGDFNGILAIGIPEAAAAVFFLALFALNLFVFIRFVYPQYKQSFSTEEG